MSNDAILSSKVGRVATLTLNRPDSLNALDSALMSRMVALLAEIEADREIAVVIVTGAGRAFAAGADIKEMAGKSFSDMYLSDHFAGWDAVARFRKPLIAAVNGFALGGGCELAMLCDIIIASNKAKFGQPEIKLGVTPGMGGSQRLTRAIGKARAMDLILTGRMIDAAEADRVGLVSRVVAHDTLLAEANSVAATLASYSQVALISAKEMVLGSLELSTTEGVRFERRLFHALFGTHDQKEGMAAFLEKRTAAFKDA